MRGHTNEYRQFLRISMGSCAELDTQAIIANRRGYITKQELDDLSEDLNHESRMLMNLINTLWPIKSDSNFVTRRSAFSTSHETRATSDVKAGN